MLENSPRHSLQSLHFEIQRFEQLSNHQLYQILQSRCDVFVVEQQCAYQDLDGIDLQAWHVQGFVKDNHHNEDIKDNKDNLAVYARIIPPNVHPTGKPTIGRVITVKEFRGQNLARKLMIKAIEFCHTYYPRQPIYICAQTYLLDFYQSLGFVPQGERYLEDGIPHIDMILSE